ncbi:uncharacterized protein LOC117100442 [Anneissia japonica]|uniref:uncharacterized protein LOC117100442 n=1 Tax=Anneissia japonica TaxID=1529436 RepID=UPI0014259C4B|nr:uncharacterized protein LOC117100442 [Anneissia japonica]
MMKLDLLGRWKWVCFWSISLYITFVPECEADVQPCYIGSLSLLQGSWVAAYDDLASHISGCTVAYNSSTSVVAYVLSLTSAGLAKPNLEKQPVVLNIEQTPFAMLQSSAKIVFVLSSSDPVSWDIRMTTLFKLPSFLVFVSRPNTVNPLANIDVSVEENLPTSRDGLIEWVGNKYQKATFAEVSYANYISVSLNQETHVNRTCVVSDDWKQNGISAKFINEKPIQGCKLPLNSRELNPEIYVIEHKRVEQGVFKQTVTLNLRTVKDDTRLHNIMLLLKSSSHVLWDVHGTSGIGSLKIQSNGKVSSQDYVFESVTPSPEFENESGQDLVEYLERQYRGVVQYLSVDTANRIEVTLEAPGVPMPPNILIQDSSLVLQGDNLLKHIIHTQCYNQSMVVAISLTTLRKYNMRPKDISLRDRGCNATVNETHMVFTSKLGQCGMELKSSIKQFVYVNEVLFNPGAIENGSSLTDEDGGSGLLPDDEDASNQRRPSVSEVHCSYTIISSTLGHEFEEQEDIPVTYKICTGPKCPPLQFSVSTIYNDPNILATVWSCSVTSVNGAIVDNVIIKNGCTDLDSVILTRNVNESMRINSLPFESKAPYELTCEVAICSPHKKQKYPQCPDRKTDLPCALRDPIESKFHTTYKIHFEPKIIPETIKSPNSESNVGSNIETVTTEAPKTTEIIGLNTKQVVGIAFAAFLMGIFFVTAIWCIHVHTAIPRRNQEETSASQPPPYQPTSNGYAGYRQVPNGCTSNGYAGNNGHTLNGFGPTINPNGIPMNGMMNSADLAMV